MTANPGFHMTEVSSEEYGNYEEYYKTLEAIPEPWNYGNIQALSQIFLPTLYSIVFIVGFIGNGIVVCVLVKYHKRTKMTDTCMFNLAVSDLLFHFIFSLPFWGQSAAISEWNLGSFMCCAVTTLYMLGFYGSIFSMILMMVDRYAIIVHARASLFSKHRSVCAGIALSSFMWAFTLAASLPTIFLTQVKNESHGLTCKAEHPEGTKWRQFSDLRMNILSWVLPLSVMVFCCWRILRSHKSQKRRKAVRLILSIVVFFFLFWTPYNIVILMNVLQHWNCVTSCEWSVNLNMAMMYVETIAFTHCCLNPIIYAFVGQKFRNLVLKMLKQWFPVCFIECTTIDSELSESPSEVSSTTIMKLYSI